MTRMTAQEVFDTAVLGVLSQGKPSINHTGDCMYRGPNGLKCAAGHVLKDQDYKRHFDINNLSIYSLSDRIETPYYVKDNKILLSRLQRVHDSKTLGDNSVWLKSFRTKARRIAKDFDLKIPIELEKEND